MALLKLTWDEFVKAALDSLIAKHPAVILTTDANNPILMRHLDYDGECKHDTPDYVYVKLADQ